MGNGLLTRRGNRTVLATIATIAIAVIAPTAASAAAPAQPTCAAGATPAPYQGQWYCPATAVGVKNTTYGTGKRILLTGVSVTSIRGTSATVSSTTMTSCPPNKYCGALVTITFTTINVSLTGLVAWPAVGSYGDLYSITSTGSLTATGFVDQDSSGTCTNPAFC